MAELVNIPLPFDDTRANGYIDGYYGEIVIPSDHSYEYMMGYNDGVRRFDREQSTTDDMRH